MSFSLNLEERGTQYAQVNTGNVIKWSEEDLKAFTFYDLVYRTLCAVMFNFVSSGHPGGSVSSGRIVSSLLYRQMRYRFSDPESKTADILSYAAGHKALGLYAMWALRNEVARITKPEMLPEVRRQLRLEDLLGFRKNPITKTPLFQEYQAKPLDGHPTPLTPFVWLSTGASGVGVASSMGLAFALKDLHGEEAPIVHVLEGEGGLTPGRVGEAAAAAASSGLNNLILHVDWNQSSIDSDRVTREGPHRGDYVQWDPREFFLVHGFNVVDVENGLDFEQVETGQKMALGWKTDHPTAVVYRTVKGWKYGIEGRKSHGAGHKFCSEEYYKAVEPFEKELGLKLPRFDGEKTEQTVERAYFDTLMVLRKALESNRSNTHRLGALLQGRMEAHAKASHRIRSDAPRLEVLYNKTEIQAQNRPKPCKYETGSKQTLRGALADALNVINQKTKGAVWSAAADLYGSTSTSDIGKGFGEGFFHAQRNPKSRLFLAGGIAEDAMGGICSGMSTLGYHVGVGASYGAFIAPLNAISARTHGIGQQAYAHRVPGTPANPFVMICGHVGVKTGEDGPTHAECNTFQMLADNHPRGTMITLTPWDPHELWPLTVAAFQKRPAVIAPFVTRPGETIWDRKALGLAPAEDSTKGMYCLLRANGKSDGTIVYQGSDVAYVFVEEILPRLKDSGLNVDVYYVASNELFDLLPEEEKIKIYPEDRARTAMMITGFTLPTAYRWIMSERGRTLSLYPHKHGRYLGSGSGAKCMEEGGLHGEAQWTAIRNFVAGK